MDFFDFDPYAYRDNDSDSDCSDYDYGDNGPDIIPPRDGSSTPPITVGESWLTAITIFSLWNFKL
jgi:hypothetical protein